MWSDCAPNVSCLMEVDVPANMKSVYGGSRQMMTYLSLALRLTLYQFGLSERRLLRMCNYSVYVGLLMSSE